MISFVDFYETEMNQELLYFTESFKETVDTLTKFLSLNSKDDLPDMISALLKFASKHHEFAKKTIDLKKIKDRSKNVNIGTRN